ncbi:MAG: MarR family transcriptional regulator [Frankiales bacterium]|nr:MarR family transcriptional regulator [Frankiales bacterium]
MLTVVSPSPSVTADLAHDLRLAVMRLARRLRQTRADHGLGLGQLSVLATLDRGGPMTAGALAALEQVRPPSLTRTLTHLEDAGLVVRSPDPDDGRQVVVSLTDEARRLVHEDRRRRDEWLASLMRDLTPEQRRVLAEALPLLEGMADS